LALTPGTRLGPYEVIAPIGEGGMGQVYRARDTKLDRDVALKVLPDSFVHDPDRLARFQREAKVLASLNHPNIAHIHGLEESNSVRALVMELVEGEDLAQRLTRGAIPIDEALPIAKQITEALETAHEQGIIHRDLKPANIKVRRDGTVKVLDFGLAKAIEPAGSSPDLSQSPTITSPAMTHAGMIIGTAAYMSPEQARGLAVDKRSDVWSFGCVLYEMLTARRAFAGDTVPETLANVLKNDPDLGRVPVSVRRLLRLTLEKDPSQRLRHLGDAMNLLDSGSPPPSRSLTWLMLSGAVVVVGLVALTVARLFSHVAPPAVRAVRFTVPLPAEATLTGPGIALLPDDSGLVYASQRPGASTSQLFFRPLDRLEPVEIRGTEGGTSPFVSPDGRWIGFIVEQEGKLKKVPVGGSAAFTICDASNLTGATWLADDSIVFATGGGDIHALWRVAAAGAAPISLAQPDGKTELGFAWPEVLPGGRDILFAIQRPGLDYSGASIAVLRLDTGERRVILDGGTSPHYVDKHLLFARAGEMLAVPFDLRAQQIAGGPVPVISGVATDMRTGSAQIGLSPSGSVAYAPGSDAGISRTLAWVDRHGDVKPLAVPHRTYAGPRISPDGQSAALAVSDVAGVNQVWLYAFSRGTLSRLTFEAEEAETPVWTPDGKRITYAAGRQLGRRFMSIPADGSGPPELLAKSDAHIHAESWSPDGTTFLVEAVSGNASGSLLQLQMASGSHTLQPFLRTTARIHSPTISPDGRWLAYSADDTGRFEIYLQPFPGLSGRQQLSVSGGFEPVWSRDGRELFFRNNDAMMVARIETRDGKLETGTPMLLFEHRFSTNGNNRDTDYDVSVDGQHFLMIEDDKGAMRGGLGGLLGTPPDARSIVMAEGWVRELGTQVPVK
jgi:serine/threonine-protein kinase